MGVVLLLLCDVEDRTSALRGSVGDCIKRIGLSSAEVSVELAFSSTGVNALGVSG